MASRIAKASILDQNRFFANPLVYLFLALLLFLLIWIICPQQFIASDPWSYSIRAFNIVDSGEFGRGIVFDHRLAITVPTAFFYKILGVNILTTNLMPLCASLLIILVVWLALPDRKSKLIGLGFCLTSIPLWESAMELYPDIIAAAFMGLSCHFLFARKNYIQSRKLFWVFPSLAIGSLFIAFLAKMSAYWVLPLWVFAWAADRKNEKKNRLLRRFYLPAAVSGLCLVMAYAITCHEIWDDPFSRLKAIQNLSGNHLWAWGDKTFWDFAKRLTIGPPGLLIHHYGYLVGALAFLGFVIAPQAIKPWGYYSASCIFFFWFGTTSFTSYEPIPLVARMTLPLLPAIYIFAAFATSRLPIISNPPRWMNSKLLIFLVLGSLVWQCADFLSSRLGREIPESTAMTILRRNVMQNPSRDFLLVCSDTRSPRSLMFYFGYRYPDNLLVEYVPNLADQPLHSQDAFIFLDRKRSQYMQSAYGHRNFDAEIDSLQLFRIYESRNVVLFKADEADMLDQLFSPQQ